MSEPNHDGRARFSLRRLFASITLFAASLGLLHCGIFRAQFFQFTFVAWIIGFCGAFGSLGIPWRRGPLFAAIGLAAAFILGFVVFVTIMIPGLKALGGL